MVSRLDTWAQRPPGLQLDTPFLVFAPDTSEMHSAAASYSRGSSLPARQTI